MKKSTKIVIYITLGVFIFQNIFFDFTYATTEVVCVQKAQQKSCNAYGDYYTYKSEQDCCVCKIPSINGECDSAGYWVTDDGCCVASCSVCTATSNNFQKYLNLQVELFQLLWDDINEKNIQDNSLNRKGFFSKLIMIPVNFIKSVKKYYEDRKESAKKKYSSFVTKTLIVYNLTIDFTAKGVFNSISILLRNRPFIREWKKLQDIDAGIYDMMRDLAEDGRWTKTLSPNSIIKLGEIRQKYTYNQSNVSGIFDEFNLIGSVKYQDLLQFMMRLNSFMKGFIANPSWISSWLVFKIAAGKFEKSKAAIRIVFSEEFIKKLSEDYECAEGLKGCNTNFSEIKKMFSFLPTIKQNFNEIKNTIKKANKNFIEAFSHIKRPKDSFKDSKLTDKQIELLRTVYGLDTNKLTEKQKISLGSLLDSAPKKSKKNNAALNPKTLSDIDNSSLIKQGQEYERQKEQNESIANDDLEEYKSILSGDVVESMLMEELASVVDFVLEEKNNMKQMLLVHDQSDTNRYFLEVVKTIQNIIEKSIGTKDTNGLVNYLGTTCELQCSNKGTKNCFK